MIEGTPEHLMPLDKSLRKEYLEDLWNIGGEDRAMRMFRIINVRTGHWFAGIYCGSYLRCPDTGSKALMENIEKWGKENFGIIFQSIPGMTRDDAKDYVNEYVFRKTLLNVPDKHLCLNTDNRGDIEKPPSEPVVIKKKVEKKEKEEILSDEEFWEQHSKKKINPKWGKKYRKFS
jgi:hypothetical protein